MAYATHIVYGFEIAGRLRSRGELDRQFRAGPHGRPLRVLEHRTFIFSRVNEVNEYEAVSHFGRAMLSGWLASARLGERFLTIDDRSRIKETTPMPSKLAIISAC